MLPPKQQDEMYTHNKSSKLVQQQKPPASHEDDDDSLKKLIHRDLERQRRQEMTKLYASLRSLLPLEYIKGKRSTSDHMNEAVTYVKHLQSKMKELSDKRDKLKKLCNRITSSSTIAAAEYPPTNVSIHQYLGGLEVVLSRSIEDQRFPALSRILDMLLQEKITVVNCVYCKVEQRLIYTIQLQISDATCFEPSALQRKLSEAISSSCE